MVEREGGVENDSNPTASQAKRERESLEVETEKRRYGETDREMKGVGSERWR